VLNQQRALAEIVHQQGGEDHGEPGQANRPAPEMAEVGVQRFATGDGQKYSAQHEQTALPVARQEVHAVPRVDGREHGWRVNDVAHAERGDGHEPHERDWTEYGPDDARTALLNHEQPDQDCDRDRHDERFQARRRNLEAFYGAQDGDGGRDHAVAVEQCGTEHAQEDQRQIATRFAQVRAGERHQR